MCVIVYSKNGRIPMEELAMGMWKNPDGWGYMFHHAKGYVICRKGIQEHEFWEAWSADKKMRLGRPTVFHARFATHGTKSLDNCHPFEIKGHGVYMVHNGILPLEPLDKNESDTKVFARVLADFPVGFLKKPGIKMVVHMAAMPSRIVFMDKKGEVTIIGEARGYWKRRRWYSNDGCHKLWVQQRPTIAVGSSPVEVGCVQKALWPDLKLKTPHAQTACGEYGSMDPD